MRNAFRDQLNDLQQSILQMGQLTADAITRAVAMYLERIGDHATNLGEWTIYMVTGER